MLKEGHSDIDQIPSFLQIEIRAVCIVRTCEFV